jgi:hypothetical protein
MIISKAWMAHVAAAASLASLSHQTGQLTRTGRVLPPPTSITKFKIWADGTY